MKYTWIENYAGFWEDSVGRSLIIEVRDEYRARVTLLVDGVPMVRPWCGNKPAKDLPARYSPIDSPGLSVSLGRRGFSLELNYEIPEPWAPDEPESLSVSISRYSSDVAAEQFMGTFNPLGRYVRKNAEQPPPPDWR